MRPLFYFELLGHANQQICSFMVNHSNMNKYVICIIKALDMKKYRKPLWDLFKLRKFWIMPTLIYKEATVLLRLCIVSHVLDTMF